MKRIGVLFLFLAGVMPAESPKLFSPTLISGWQNFGGIPVTVVNSDRVFNTTGIRSGITVAPMGAKKTVIVAVKHDAGVMYPLNFPQTEGSCGLVMRSSATGEFLTAEVVSRTGGQRWFRVSKYDAQMNRVADFDLAGQDFSHLLWEERLWISGVINGTGSNAGITIYVSGKGISFPNVVFVNLTEVFTGGVPPTHAGMFISRTGGPGSHGAALTSFQLK